MPGCVTHQTAMHLFFAAALVALVGCSQQPKLNKSKRPPPTPKKQTTQAKKPLQAPSKSAPKKTKPKLYAKSRFVWIRPAPNPSGWIGYLWFGGSVTLKQTEPVRGPGCGAWYAIEPRGYVCVDDKLATLNAADPELNTLQKYAPRLNSPWPHDYAESRGAQKYTSVPNPKQQRRREWDLDDHLRRIRKASQGQEVHKSLQGVDLSAAPSAPIELGTFPSTVREPRKRLLPLSTVAYAAETRDHNRNWLLTADLTFLPKDRVVPYKKVTFRGIDLKQGKARLPLAFFRKDGASVYEKKKEGHFVKTNQRLERLSWVELDNTTLEKDGIRYRQLRNSHSWIQEKDAVIPKPQSNTPWGAKVFGKDTKDGPAGLRTWMEASIWQGWLIAYEGTQPVYVTLISPGRGGTPEPGKDPLSTASTPVGTFKITGKFATATMVAPHEFIHSDVPWTQNFSGPHALHGAYWHNNWGNRMSAGCVNVSPIDGKWLYSFTEPRAPEGWHGVRWRPSAEAATIFVVHS